MICKEEGGRGWLRKPPKRIRRPPSLTQQLMCPPQEHLRMTRFGEEIVVPTVALAIIESPCHRCLAKGDPMKNSNIGLIITVLMTHRTVLFHEFLCTHVS